MIKYILYSCIAIGLSVSCSNDAVYEKNQAIPNRSWSYEEKPRFDVHIDDNKSKYNVYINLRHSNEYDFSNIFVLLHEKGNKLLDTAYRKEISLAQLDGRWLGNSAGSLYEIQYLAKDGFVFPDTGMYTFTIEQNMRETPLKDVVDVGIKVVKQ
ncbi:gliding motility-associated lipoprotein GldH [Sphingobacterium nematocida]|uniref:Gliding motility-associated lipoprotein GldH n=1 Tax=Sphingobacterium nematocida TaxID=1513896 RepID=A0A1T5DIM5_9SPHI|nr:gliding motility lipoprotein GldH [Sphingobacterium nematocida]SKB71340.1 gliding motility-associated lipoprotein GldH [Sphingobacterium nematocida]